MAVLIDSNVSSTTTVVNGTVYTQNLINLGDTSSCSSGPSYCNDGYSIYVPCLKNITRGQKVCFQTYLTDNSIEDVLDLVNNDICGLTLDLSGLFGCSYGSYTWPDDITFLQGEELLEVKCEEFNGRICNLDLGYLLFENDSIKEVDGEHIVDVRGYYGKFYEGETPELSAYDSPTHIFLGWTTSTRINELCQNFTLNDLIVCEDNEWIWNEPIHEDITIYAVYRKRKSYEILIDFDNRHSYFMVRYMNHTTMMSDKKRDKVEVLEGYHFIVTCYPLVVTRKENGRIVEKTYIFRKWKDGDENQSRQFLVNDELFKNGELKLFADCGDELIDLKRDFNVYFDLKPIPDDFRYSLPKEHVLENGEFTYYPSDDIIDYDKVCQIYNTEKDKRYLSIKDTGHITFDSNYDGGNLKLVLKINISNFDFFKGKKKQIKKKHKFKDKFEKLYKDTYITVGDIIVRNGSQTITYEVTPDTISEVVFDFDNCEDGVFTIETTLEELLIENLCVFERIITNKGEIELCIPPEDTLNFYTGVLNMSGAICVNDNWYGLDSIQIGTINKLKPINIIEQA